MDDAELAALAEMLGIDPASPKAENLRAAISDIGDTYRRWNDRGAGAFNRAEARQALEDLFATVPLNYAALTALNEHAFQAVHDSLLMMRPAPVGPGDSVMTALAENRIDQATLRQAAQDAIARLKAKKGPEREGEQAWAVAELCKLYEEMTGKKATHSNKGQDLAYRQEPVSPAGRFVRRCFRSIDGSVGATRINRAMRSFVEGRG